MVRTSPAKKKSSNRKPRPVRVSVSASHKGHRVRKKMTIHRKEAEMKSETPSPQNKPPPNPVHVQRTFDSPWEDVPITATGPVTYYAVIFDNDFLFMMGGWQTFQVCPACGVTSHKKPDKPE